MIMTRIPIIDLDLPFQTRDSHRMLDALHTYGCMYLHTKQKEIIQTTDAVFGNLQQFFALDHKVKVHLNNQNIKIWNLSTIII